MTTNPTHAEPIHGDRKPVLAIIVRNALMARMSRDEIRKQIEAAFPGVPVIFTDAGTEIELIHAVE